MSQVIIIGKRSNLSKAIHNTLPNSILISIHDVLNNQDVFTKFNGSRLLIIFNNFQKSTKLGNLQDPINYINNTILSTAIILSKLKNYKVDKVIYTSSASVYGDNNYCKESDILQPSSLPASLKVSNENLVSEFCKSNNIDYTIARIFNMYGGNDNFSIISKIISAVKGKNELSLINNGSSIRDYIHIQDVVSMYIKILEEINIPVVNIASGNGISVRSILDFLANKGIKIETKNLNRNEIKASTACIEKKKRALGDNKTLINVEEYILSKVKN
ncbi:NAD(P)-dependent oxidoreductase [Candidatus Pseudothioglobus singularis]|nr:NAD(P)-dependent oxidoreductase [Candidatus Pseudothioglobus singularis]